MFDKIVCAIDFSPGSRQVLHVAARLARDSDARLVLAYASHVPPFAEALEYPMPVDTIARIHESAREALYAAEAEVRALGAAQVSTRFTVGIPWIDLEDAARAEAADLIAIGSHGRTGIGRFLVGSVAEKVVRHAPCSVLVVRGEPPAFSRVLCAIDFSEQARAAALQAADVAAAELVLLHAFELPLWDTGELPGEAYLPYKHAQDHLARLAGELATKTKAAVSVRVQVGPAVGTLVDALGAGRFDLAVVGTHGRTGVRRALLGSVAERIVRHAPCSVLVSRGRG